jgi:hypothetical protein
MLLASIALFAQRGGGGGGGGAGGGAGGLCCCGVAIAIIAVGMLISIMYLLALSRCIAQISPRNQPMSPGMVWLVLIPIFGPIWLIITMFKLADSLATEYRQRGMRGDGDFGKMAAILYLIGMVVPLVGLIGFIMHWMKVSGYTQELMRRPYDDYDDEDEEEEEEERPRSRRRRARDDDDDDDR